MRAVVGLLGLAVLGCVTAPPRAGAPTSRVGLVVAASKEPGAARNVALQKKLRRWEDEAAAALAEQLVRRGYPLIIGAEPAALTWTLGLDVVAGNRALRAITLGKAGTGFIRATLVAEEAGRVRYRTVVERETRVSADGWDLQFVVDEVLEALALPEAAAFGTGEVAELPAPPWCRAETLPEWSAASDEERRVMLRRCRRAEDQRDPPRH